MRRAARMARRVKGDLHVLHVRQHDGTSSRSAAFHAVQEIVDDVGGTWQEVTGEDPARTVVEFAREHQITQIVVGATRRSRWEEFTRGSVVRKILRFAAESGIDVHVIARREAGREPAEEEHS